jgi:hypothetical protein
MAAQLVGSRVVLSSTELVIILYCSIIAILRSVLQLLVTANVVPSSPIVVTLMMEAIRSSETSVVPRAARRNINLRS